MSVSWAVPLLLGAVGAGRDDQADRELEAYLAYLSRGTSSVANPPSWTRGQRSKRHNGLAARARVSVEKSDHHRVSVEKNVCLKPASHSCGDITQFSQRLVPMNRNAFHRKRAQVHIPNPNPNPSPNPNPNPSPNPNFNPNQTEWLSGVSVMLTSNHGYRNSYDWTNLLHWSSAMAYSALVAQSLSDELRAALHATPRVSDLRLTHVLLPTISAATAEVQYCKPRSKTPAFLARGAHSEMFALLAQAAALSVADALNITAPRRPPLALCKPQLTRCFEALVQFSPSGVQFIDRLRHSYSAWTHGTHGRAPERGPHPFAVPFQQAVIHLAAPSASPRPSRLYTPRRRVVLLTRQTQSRWLNRAKAAKQLRGIVERAGASLVDAGDAEELGQMLLPSGRKCYLAWPQIDLWRNAWLVVSVVGAHESNLLFMPRGAAGLLESTNCGWYSPTYRTLADAVGTGYFNSTQLDRGGKQCERVTSQVEAFTALNMNRVMDLRHDTLGSRLSRILAMLSPQATASRRPSRRWSWSTAV